MNNYFGKDDRSQKVYVMFWAILLGVLLARAFYFGLTYFRFLDDYATYGVFNRRNANIFEDIVLYYRHFTWRPLAFFADAYITQWFWNQFWVVLLWYTLMHFATVYLFHRVMVKSRIKFGLFGIVIIALTPILSEAVYWIGASTRLVPGMFFAIMSAYMLLRHIEREENNIYGKRYLNLYIVFNVLAIGWFEQIIVFNLVFSILIIWMNRHRIFANIGLMYVIPVLNTVFISIYYAVLAPFGRVGERGHMISIMDIPSQIFYVTRSLGGLLIRTNYQIMSGGFVKSLGIMMNVQGIVMILVLAVISVCLYFAYNRTFLAFDEQIDIAGGWKILLGLILTLAPFGPFYLLQNHAMAPRTVYPAIFGIALILDAVLDALAEMKPLRKIRPAVSVVFIVPFFMIYVAEINNYRLIEQYDVKIMDSFLNAFEASGLDDQTTLILFNTEIVYADIVRAGGEYRLENVTSNNWAMQGMANSESDLFRFRLIEPVRTGRDMVEPQWLNDYHSFFGLDDELNVVRLELDGDNLLYYGEDRVFGRIEPYEDHLFFFRGAKS